MTESKPSVLITGASRGIGRAVALDLAADHHLILAGRDLDTLLAQAAELPSAVAIELDLADSSSIERAIRTARGAGALSTGNGGLTGAVLSAGVWAGNTVEKSTAEDWAFTMHMNVTAQAILTRELLPELREGRGTIAYINSGSGFTSKPGNSVYSASKFALRALADALREEERPNGVRVASIHPGRVATDMQRELRAYEGGEYVESDYARPETVAATVRLALTAPAEASIDTLSVRPR